MKDVRWILSTLFILYSTSGLSQTISQRADSSFTTIHSLKGQQQLEAWHSFISLEEVLTNKQWAPMMVNQYIKECKTQGNAAYEARARQLRMEMALKFDSLELIRQFYAEDTSFQNRLISDYARMSSSSQLTQQRSRFVSGSLILVFVVVGLVGFLSINNRWRRRLEIKNQQLRRERNVVVAQNKQLAIERDRAEAASIAKTSFMQSITHEIRTPLNAISGFSQVLLTDDYNLPEQERKNFSLRIQQSTRALTNILDDLLQISDLESSTDMPAAINYPAADICKKAIEAVKPRLHKGVSLNNACGIADDALYWTYPQLLLIALSKVLDNAAKFTKKGYISLSLHTAPLPENMGGGMGLAFSVSDTGPGIPSDKADFIFERFSKLDSFVPGSGLGLSVARMIAERLGGSLTLDTSYIGGAKFDLIIPLSHE